MKLVMNSLFPRIDHVTSPTSSISFPSDSSCQLDIFGHNCDSFRVNCTQIRVFKQPHHVSFSRFLQSQNRHGLEPQIWLHFLSNLTHESLERQFPDEQLSWLLELADFSQRDRAWSESMRLLDSALGSHMRRFASCLVCKLFAGGFGSRVFAGGHLGSGHFVCLFVFCFSFNYLESANEAAFEGWGENYGALSFRNKPG